MQTIPERMRSKLVYNVLSPCVQDGRLWSFTECNINAAKFKRPHY